MGIVVDLFAGGGGASLGLEQAGLPVDVAVNHDPEAIAMHAANHPRTEHHVRDVWEVDPLTACAGRSVDLMWASPNCTHFSRARGGKPRDHGNRSLSDVITKWARAVRPPVVLCENVNEWTDWGPLDERGQPIKARKGEDWRRWLGEWHQIGYRTDHRRLIACDYGAPTTRERTYFVARCDDAPIGWPAPSHGEVGNMFGLPSHPSAARCIDWTIPATSIFDRPEPLVDNTLDRIARGIRKFVFCPDPYIVGDDIAATMIHLSNGERPGQAPRVYDIRQPMPTVVAGGIKQALVIAFLSKYYGTSTGADLRRPMPTVTGGGTHLAPVLATIDGQPDRSEQVAAFLTTYYSTAVGSDLRRPLPTVTTHDRFALVTVRGVQRRITDIATRHLTPRELARAQGFPDSYVLDTGDLSRSAQVRMIGNSVCKDVAVALARANDPRRPRELRRAA